MLCVNHVLFIFLACLCAGNPTDELGRDVPTMNSELSDNAVVELLIVCDMEVTALFQNNRKKMLEYWAAYMHNVNMRFKTISSIDIVVQVAFIQTIQNSEDQPFIEQSRDPQGIATMPVVIHKFSEWIYAHHDNCTEFDIAVLITAANMKSLEESVTYQGTACQKLNAQRRHFSTLVLHWKATIGFSCTALEIALGTLMGAPMDEDTKECQTLPYIMSRNVTCSGDRVHFFSKCTSAAIGKYIRSEAGSCFRNTTTTNIAPASSRRLTQPSLKDQCTLITNNSRAYPKNHQYHCEYATCEIKKFDSTSTKIIFRADDNAICNIGSHDNDRCFRGKCMRPAKTIQNVGTGLCLHVSDRFSANDNLVMRACAPWPSMLDQFIVYMLPSTNIYHLWTVYSPADKPENLRKYLTVDKEKGLLQNQDETTYRHNSSKFEWNIIADKDDGEFVLLHRETRFCATVDCEEVKGGPICNHEDLMTRWRYYVPTAEETTYFDGRETSKPDGTMAFSTCNRNGVSPPKDQYLLNYITIPIVAFLCGITAGIIFTYAISTQRHCKNQKLRAKWSATPQAEDNLAVLYCRDDQQSPVQSPKM